MTLAGALRAALAPALPELGELAAGLGAFLAALLERDDELLAMVTELWFGPQEVGSLQLAARAGGVRLGAEAEGAPAAAAAGDVTVDVTCRRLEPRVVGIRVRNQFCGLPAPAAMEEAVRGVLGLAAEHRPTAADAREALQAVFPATAAAMALDFDGVSCDVSSCEDDSDCLQVELFVPWLQQACAAMYPGLWATLSRVVTLRVACRGGEECARPVFALELSAAGVRWRALTRGRAVAFGNGAHEDVPFSLAGEPHAFRFRVDATLKAVLGLAHFRLPGIELDVAAVGRPDAGGGMQLRVGLHDLDHLTGEALVNLFVPVRQLRAMLQEHLRVDLSVLAGDGGGVWSLFVDVDARAPPVSRLLVRILRAVVSARLTDKVRMLQAVAEAVGTDLQSCSAGGS